MLNLKACSPQWLLALFFLGVISPVASLAQIDPVKRELLQLGDNFSFEGRAPIAAYAFFYYNQPEFIETNLTLRLAIAPVYLDSELGIAHALGPDTDLGIGLAGGGFADSYYEVRQGKYLPEESFDGDGATFSSSIYHLFNPSQRIPLNGVLRGEVHYATYEANSDTDSTFEVPKNTTSFNVRTGFRLGGKEPTITPDVALELSAWYEGQFRINHGAYGFNGDREIEAASHLFWGRALFAYTLPELKHNFMVSVTGGASADTDRLSAYRLGGLLPLASEFPLTLPGYYYQELSATRFALFNGNYLLPFGPKKRWELTAVASSAYVDYLPGLEQPGHWNSGVGGGIGYHSSSDAWHILLDYGYGFDAIRTHGRGAQNIGILIQWNLGRTKGGYYNPGDNFLLRGLDSFLNSFQ